MSCLSRAQGEKEQKQEQRLRRRCPMGRYKSVLMAEQDARDFPHHVLVPVPPNGLGKRMDAIAAWIDLNIGPDWRMHGHLGKEGHMGLLHVQVRGGGEGASGGARGGGCLSSRYIWQGKLV
jgi:hypothetical protein